MVEAKNPILQRMLERLFASMVSGPAMNCRPHNSRQRVDLATLARLGGASAGEALLSVIAADGEAKLAARVPAPSKMTAADEDEDDMALSVEDKAAKKAWSEQQSLITKLRVIADDARTYEQDTGVHVLDIGFPLLSLPPGSFGGRAGPSTRRVLAPIAFVPVTLTVKSGTKQTVEIACRGEGVDLVRPNAALLAWLEQQTGQGFDDLFADEAGENAWKEITDLVRRVAERVDVAVPELFTAETLPAELTLASTPRADDDDTAGKGIVTAAVIGLFPTSNQGMLRDTREMVDSGAADGPIDSFVRLGVSFDAAAADEQPEAQPQAIVKRVFADERLISQSDPCQTRAVRMARANRGLVIHGPPGTGKSQTIANIIGDHLADGERVLFVCDKRTALDVVADRLNALGLGGLLAVVHDAQRDQREFYRSVREQLEALSDAPRDSGAAKKLEKIDAELQQLHDDLTQYYRDLMGHGGDSGSFHHLVGQWLSDAGATVDGIDERGLQQISTGDFNAHAGRLKELLTRGEQVGYADNPWTAAAGVTLPAFLETPANVHTAALAACVAAAGDADASLNQDSLPFAPDDDLPAEAERRRTLAGELRAAADAASTWAEDWASANPEKIGERLVALRAAAADMATATPLDAALLVRTNKELNADPGPVDAAALRVYATAFRAKLAAYSAAARAGGGADDAVRHWLAAGDVKAAAARKRLAAAAPIAAAVESSTLDASMLARFEGAPIPPQLLVEWLAALNGYLDIAGKWTAFLHGSAKTAAKPAVAHFGLSLSAASAQQVKQFLTDVQKRADLQAVLRAATGTASDARPDDAELIADYRRHVAVLDALAAPPVSDDASSEVTPDVAGVVNELIASDLAKVSPALQRYGLASTAADAERLADFIDGYRRRLSWCHAVADPGENGATRPPDVAMSDDATLATTNQELTAVLTLLAATEAGTPRGDATRRFMLDESQRDQTAAALDASPEQALRIAAVETSLAKAGLLTDAARRDLSTACRAAKPVGPAVSALAARLDTLENVLRVSDGMKRLPDSLTGPAATLLASRCRAADGFAVVRRNVLAGEIVKRLRENPQLQAVDGQRLQTSFERYRKLSEKKKELVREHVVDSWTAKQKARLLAATGNRLNGTGADLRRRLTLRGEKAMRLRQVIAHGRQSEGGDPLFDLRPVWMASPETVAQLFAREPLFDVIVFDEASQCRLEEALPVLTRGKRLVIAGDPKQLPPTRFFESAVTTSEDVDGDTEQELFEAHQGEVEDLLTAALSLDGMAESYLNVHYRSRNADLIDFSNDHFYGSRLQAIPGHPKHRVKYAPITLYRADGVYEKRRNVVEAERVVQIVHDLLRRADPPSIGIACFNMPQRDLILETLEERAEADGEFARKLADARARQGHGSSEGLFVKNLENVQGDERDHLIISTTYGPTKDGKFRRSFGPLGMSGGGRRLNVLVTRSRQEIHIVTSIPRAAYASLPDVPQGTQPGGAWLLFAYLNFAEKLKDEYETMQRVLADSSAGGPAGVTARPSRSPSQFAKALGQRLAVTAGASSDVHWGNDGFCVDVAVLDAAQADGVSIGVQCDMTRFAGSDDPVEWDVFQNTIHQQQGWTIHRVWTPHFFRDPDGHLAALRTAIEQQNAPKTAAEAKDEA